MGKRWPYDCIDDAMRSKKSCAYCGITGHVTREHVPPRAFFVPKALPKGTKLLTVDACSGCNEAFSQLIESFKPQLSMIVGADTSSAEAFWASSRRTLAQNGRLRRNIYSRVQITDVDLGATTFSYGIWLQDKTVHDEVCRYLLRGLYYYTTGQPLDARTDVEIDAFRECPQLDLPLAWIRIGDQFAFALIEAADTPGHGLCIAGFYEAWWVTMCFVSSVTSPLD